VLHFNFSKTFGKAGITDMRLDEQSSSFNPAGKGAGMVKMLQSEISANCNDKGSAGNTVSAGLFEQSNFVIEDGSDGKPVNEQLEQLSMVKEAGSAGRLVNGQLEQLSMVKEAGRSGKLVNPH
jgi:hypothetical protein